MDLLNKYHEALKSAIKKEIKEDFMFEFHNIIVDVIKKELALIQGEDGDEEYVHIDEIMAKHRIGRTTFFKVTKQFKVHSVRQGRYMIYNKKQFAISLRQFIPTKPNFKKAA